MKVILEPAGTGKTEYLIRLANNFNGYIVVRDMKTVYYVASLAVDLGYKINFPLTYDEFKNRQYHGKNCKKIFIDDADAFLQSLSMAPIEAITLTLE